MKKMTSYVSFSFLARHAKSSVTCLRVCQSVFQSGVISCTTHLSHPFVT